MGSEASDRKAKRGKRGRIRSVEMTIRFETSYAPRTIERRILDALIERPGLVEGDSCSISTRKARA